MNEGEKFAKVFGEWVATFVAAIFAAAFLFLTFGAWAIGFTQIIKWVLN